jgi:heavy metal sensor kinase
MRSIRLSLTVYFLALLAVAFGAASLLAYRTTKSSLEARQRAAEEQLRAKQTAAAELLRAKHEQDKSDKKATLDAALLSQARTLAGLVQFQFDWSRVRPLKWGFFSTQVLAAAAPNAPLPLALWATEAIPREEKPRRDARDARDARDVRDRPPGSPGPHRDWGRVPTFSDEVYARVFNSMKTEIKLTNNDLLEHVDEEVAEFFQINSAWGSVYRSQKMEGRSFDFDPGVFKSKVVDEQFDDARLGPNLKLRRVTLKAPAARFVPFGGAPRIRTGRSRSQERPPVVRTEPWAQPAIFIQCACNTQKRDDALAVLARNLKQELGLLDERLAEDLRSVDAQTDASLQSLRNRLLAVSLFTFAAAVLGTFVLVRLGLAPLHRLGEAVSRVSEKDFRLQYDSRLPHELSPIAERLNHTLEQLKRAFAREKQATADISHELRTPLAALMTTIDVALRKPRSADEYREALEDCRASGKHINEAVERLLALARLDAGVDALRKRPVDAAELARQCVAGVKPLAEARGLSLSLRSEESPLHTDPDKLREILNNLLHNAIEYNRQGGSIDVDVARQNGHLCLQVQDTGIGIPATARPHIFERFFRADPSRQADGLHAGLGLAIVKGYLDLMGGTIDVDSTEGQGSTFRVWLPA